MNNYQIIWFDDEFNTSLESIKMQFDDFGIAYKGFENAEEGVKYIKSNYHLLDAVVIDGNFFKNKVDKAIDETGKALNMVVDALKEIKFKKDIPYFILSGKLNFRERNNPLIDLLDIEKVYDKLKEEDTRLLCDSIIRTTDLSPIGSLKIKYHDVFSICADDKLGHSCFEKLLVLAQALNDPGSSQTAEDLFLPIRKLLEKLFVKLSEMNVIDPNLIKEKGWINGAKLFLSNKNLSYILRLDTHPLIHYAIDRLLFIVQDSSHAEGGLILKIDQYCNQFRSNYLYKSSVYLLFEILTYFDKYIEDHQDYDFNRSMWEKKDILDVITLKEDDEEFKIGEVINLNEGKSFAFFKPTVSGENIFIPPKLVKEFNLTNGTSIKVRFEEYLDKISKLPKKQVVLLEIIK